MTTIHLKPIRANSGLTLNGNRYRLTAGQTSIELPQADADTLAANFPQLIESGYVTGIDFGGTSKTVVTGEFTPKTTKKKVVAADAAPADETSL